MMEERSLRITGTNQRFFNKLTDTLTKILIPTKIGINGMLISIKRNNLKLLKITKMKILIMIKKI